MPRYDFICPSCGKEEERYSTVAARHEQDCACGTRLTKLITLAAPLDDTIDETHENLGDQVVHFDSRARKARYLKEHGIMEFMRNAGPDDKHCRRWV